MGKEKFQKVFGNTKPLIAMIHTAASPGAPMNALSPVEIVAHALNEAEVYASEGVDALMIENMHDVPYVKRQAAPEVVALMTRIAAEIKRRFALPLGIQILAGANREALAAALVSGADFIRAEGFVFGHLADEGYMESDAAELLRYRKYIGAEHIAVFADIKKKHASHTITADVDLAQTAHAAAFFSADGVIVTGSSTGQAARPGDVEAAGTAGLPVLVGSGITDANLPDFYPLADGFIVGSYFKQNGHWANDLDRERIRGLVTLKKTLDANA